MIIYHVFFFCLVIIDPKDPYAYQKALEILQKESRPGKYGEGKSYRDLLEELIRMLLLQSMFRTLILRKIELPWHSSF